MTSLEYLKMLQIKIHGTYFNLTMNIGSIMALVALSTFVKQRIRVSLLAGS